MTKYLLIAVLSDGSLSIAEYETQKELVDDNPKLLRRGLFGEIEYDVDVDSTVIAEVSQEHDGLYIEPADLYGFEDVVPHSDSTSEADDWIDVEVNGFAIKVPKGTTPNQLEEVFGSASGYEDPTLDFRC